MLLKDVEIVYNCGRKMVKSQCIIKSFTIIEQKSTVFDVAMVTATAERGPRGGLLYHSHSYSSFSPPNLLLVEFGIRDIMYTSIEILDDLMYYIKYLRIYKKIETNRVFKMNKKSVKA